MPLNLFSKSDMDKIQKVAVKSSQPLTQAKTVNKSVNKDLKAMSDTVIEYFKDSPAILITNKEDLHDYIDKCLAYGYAGIDTETTGLDRVRDYIVGASLYVPGMPECYIPIKHMVPLFDTPYANQMSYEDVAAEFERLKACKLIFANADYDLAMIWKDLKVDFNDACYYDVIIAWRCIKEDELHNDLKSLYNKYVLKGAGDPKRFSDFFTPKLFPYCKPEVAKLYAANDAKITFELFHWQLPYIQLGNPKCEKKHLQKIAKLIWDVEFPMIKVCQNMFRNGIFLDKYTGSVLNERYDKKYNEELKKLQVMVQEVIDNNIHKIPSSKKKPFLTGDTFNPESPLQVKYLLYDLLELPKTDGQGTGKEVLHDFNLPVTNQILKVRSLGVLINTFVKKMPRATTSDSRIHAQFKQIGAGTGRMSSAEPNLQNIPSHAVDIRHLFRGTSASEDILPLKVIDNEVSFSTSAWNSVKSSDETKKVLHDVVVGDFIQFNTSNETYVGRVVSTDEVHGIATIRCLFDNILDSVNKISLSIYTPPYVVMSSDYSQQEPKLTGFISKDPSLIKAFQEGKDIYASIASISFNVPYEECLEFHPVTHEYQKAGKQRRSEAKTILLGVTYGRSIPSIADQLYGTRTDMSDEEKVKSAQKVYDAVMNGFPAIRSAMLNAQNSARTYGYTETILGRRRHLPSMQLPDFEFVPMTGYVNPDIDPLDPSTFQNKNGIPDRIIDQLTKEFKGYKYFGQIVKRTKELAADYKIKVVNNRRKIGDATRQCLNSEIQGSAADMTKMAILNLENSEEWKAIGGRLLVPVHDELICEVPMQNAEKGAELLAKLMVQAADFLPFPMKCDVEVTNRWYGLEFPCPYTKASSIDTDIEDEIKWIQYMLIEMEYLLPVIPDENGEARGNAAKGVSGKWTDEMKSAIDNYIKRWDISKDQFLDHIEKKVLYGI